ncbi:hypothetical protein E1B28_004525 [Marasmius oreades]|uniref:Uncharacterized protein n=1 Tax=Marasmius oreades TaxID=181124 RepID=A0A9P7UYU0_9AGAR|nr:uncharacterized protein E1B28_004525 [Marasmius oreades]KAG7097147.1 hypothetical protein E1B28_004525 [Marasmius oreades]
MTTLPSFVELMTTLGIDNMSSEPTPSSSSSQPPSPRTGRLTLPASSPTRSRSSPALRDQASRSRTARYTPYSPTVSSSTRRGSVSSVSSSSSEMSQRAGSPRASSSARFRRRSTSNRLTINVFGSSTDLAANTPISSYVRRKTPVTSPTSPTFSRESSDPPMPFTLPTLPPFLPQSSGSDSFPKTPDSESMEFSVPPTSPSSPEANVKVPSEDPSSPRFHTGIRISTSPRSSNTNTSQYSKHPVVQVA